jgi:hypothetical protein
MGLAELRGLAEKRAMIKRLDLTVPELSRWGGLALMVLMAAMGASWLATNVQGLGERLDQSELELDYAMGLLWWAGIAIGIWLLAGSNRHLLLGGWVAKFFMVLVAMLFYEYKYRYNLDAYMYFHMVATGEHSFFPGVDWRQENWIPMFAESEEAGSIQGQLVKNKGTENMLRLVMMVAQLTGPYYHALKVVFAFLGFLGVWLFYRAAVVILGRSFPLAFYALALYPSILFWSSILGKDPVFLLFIGLYAYGSAVWLARGAAVGLAWAVLGMLLSYLLRSWMAAIEAVPLLIATLVKLFGWAPVALAIVVGIATVGLGTGLPGPLKALEAGALVEIMASRAEGQIGQGESGVRLSLAEAQELWQTPQGIALVIFTGLFRPLPFDVTNMLVAVAALENSILLILLVVSAFKYLRGSFLKSPIVLWALTYSVSWGAAYGLIVLTNFGAGMRYRLQVLPFMILLILLLLRPEGRAALNPVQKT